MYILVRQASLFPVRILERRNGSNHAAASRVLWDSSVNLVLQVTDVNSNMVDRSIDVLNAIAMDIPIRATLNLVSVHHVSKTEQNWLHISPPMQISFVYATVSTREQLNC